MDDKKKISPKTNLKQELGQLKQDYAQQAQELERLHNSQSIFLKNLSQNIRIPLNGIVGMIDVMKMTDITQEQGEYLEIINNYGDGLISIVNDILDYSQLISKELELDEHYFFPEKIMNEIDHAFRIRIEGKGLDFNIHISPQIPLQLYGDPIRITQIISNLLNNSLKYTTEGQITIKLILLDDIQSQEANIRFVISDSGVGMSASRQKKLRAELQKKQQNSLLTNDSIGLGLSISQSLLKLYQSSIYFSSIENKGSEFWFDIIVKYKNSKLPKHVGLDSKDSDKLSILLVEDNILNQKFAVATLLKNGHKVTVAENGKIAYEKFTIEKFDLILMDIQMPIMDGVQATMNIRQFEKNKHIEKPIKIVAVTAYALDRDREKCLKAGMDKFLPKPFKPDQLIQIIDNLGIKSKN
jgi:CheY-like chemotaxis protein